MATITNQTIYLNLRPGAVMPVLHVSQGDSGLEALEFKLINGHQPWTIPAAVTDIQLNGTTPVGVFSYNDPTWSGNTVTANVTETMTAEKGVVICELRLLDSTLNSIGTLNFVISVEPSPYTNAHVSTSDMATIMAALNGSQQNMLLSKSWAVGDTGVRSGENTNNSKWWSSISESWAVGGTGNRTGENTNNSKYYADQSRIEGNGLASVFSDALDYTTGDYVIYNGILYEFTANHNAGAWNLNDVHAVNMGDEVTDLKNIVNRLRFNTVADMIADRTLSVGDIAETLGYNTKDDGFGGLYTIVSTGYAQKDYEELQNGLYAVKNIGINSESQTKSTDINLFLESAMTYQAHASEFLYSADNDITYPTCLDAGYVAGTKYMDCSTLFKLVVNRISYTDSKYGGGTNKGKGDSFKLPDDYTTTKFTGTRYAYQQAHYLANKGLCYYPNADRSNLRIGDICFFDFTGSHLATTFMGIDHVAIYMGYCGNASDGTPRYQFISNDNNSQYRELHSVFFVADSAYLSKIVLCASIPNALFSIRGDNIIVDGDTTVVRASEGLLAPYRVKEKLKSNTFYTVVMDINDASIPVAVRTINGWMYMNAYNFLYYRSTSKHKIIHVITGDLSAGTDIENSIVQIQNNSSKRLEVYNFKITEGWYDDIQSSVLAPIPLSLVSGASGFFRLYPNREAISVDFSTAHSGAFDIATYDTNLPIKNHYSVVAGRNSSSNWVPVIIHYANGTVNALTGDDSNINRLRLNDY